jgi:hypothetical protein
MNTNIDTIRRGAISVYLNAATPLDKPVSMEGSESTDRSGQFQESTKSSEMLKPLTMAMPLPHKKNSNI